MFNTKYSRLCINLDKEDDTAKSVPIKYKPTKIYFTTELSTNTSVTHKLICTT